MTGCNVSGLPRLLVRRERARERARRSRWGPGRTRVGKTEAPTQTVGLLWVGSLASVTSKKLPPDKKSLLWKYVPSRKSLPLQFTPFLG